jgi:microcompartment protein CcmL/EutN
MATGNAVAVIELGSVYKGYEVQDAMLKSADVEKLIGRTICSGKFLIVMRGTIGDVEVAAAAGVEAAGFSLINIATIPNVDQRVFPAMSSCSVVQVNTPKQVAALLIIETFSVVSAIKAADLAIKTADLELMRIHVAMAVGGKGFVVMTGSIAALESAVKPAVEYCKSEGMLAGYTILNNPHEEVLRDLL